MSVDVCVMPIAYDWAGLDDASLDVLADAENYAPAGTAHDHTLARAAVRWDARPEYPDDLTANQISAASAAASRLLKGLSERECVPLAWSEALPDPTDLDVWESRQEYIGALGNGLSEIHLAAAALSCDAAARGVEALLGAGSERQLLEVRATGGGEFPNLLFLGVAVPAPLPRVLLGPFTSIGSAPGLRNELERLSEALFGKGVADLFGEPPSGHGIAQAMRANLEVLWEGLEASSRLGLPMVVAG